MCQALKVNSFDKPPDTQIGDVYGPGTCIVATQAPVEKPMTPFESLLWNVWLTKVRTCRKDLSGWREVFDKGEWDGMLLKYMVLCQSSVSDEQVNCFRIRFLFKNTLNKTVDHKQQVKWKHVCNIFTLESMGTI